MAVTIRLSRVGSKKDPRYRIVVIPKHSRRDGKALEILGSYLPLADEKTQITVKRDRFDHWIKLGAVPSRTVSSLVKRA